MEPGLRWEGQRPCWVHVLVCERCKMFSHGPMSGPTGSYGAHAPLDLLLDNAYNIFKFKSSFYRSIWNLSLSPHLYHLLCLLSWFALLLALHLGLPLALALCQQWVLGPEYLLQTGNWAYIVGWVDTSLLLLPCSYDLTQVNFLYLLSPFSLSLFVFHHPNLLQHQTSLNVTAKKSELAVWT